MKRITLLLLCGAAVVCVAQNRFPPINLYPGDPTGNVCAGNLIQQSSTTGLIYTCQSGFMKVGGTSGAGTLTPSPQFTFFYQPSPGTTAAAQGDPNFTTDGAGHITALSFAGAGTGLTGTAASLTAGHANNLPGDFATQSAATQALGAFTTASVATVVPSAAPIIDPRHSSFAGGAVCDGVSDIGPAVQAAFNSIKTVGGQIQLVGNPLPCYWADPSQMDWSGRLAAVTIKITGQLKVGTTFSLGNGVTLLGQAGGTGLGVATGPLAKIVGPSTTGTLGTAVVAGQAQVFTPSSMAGITTSPVVTCAIASATRDSSSKVVVTPVSSCAIPIGWIPTIAGSSDTSFNNIGFPTSTTGATITFLQGSPITVGTTTGGTLTATATYKATAITVVGTTTCTTTGTVARVTNHVTATLTGPCHIPSGMQATIAGVTDSSFNGTFTVTDEDYILNTLTWYQVAADASSSGGTATGVNEDSIETTLISATSGATATAYFANAHSSTDVFGIVSVMLSQGYNTIEDIDATGSGVNWWMYRTSNNHFKNIVGGNQPFITNWGMEFNESWQTECTRCTISRAAAPKGSWAIRLTNQANTGIFANATGDIAFHRGYIYGDFKLDNGGSALTIDDHTIVEQANRGAIVLDSRNFFISTGNEMHFEGTPLMQDIATGFTQKCVVNSLYGGTANAEGTIYIKNAYTTCFVNDNYAGQVKVDGIAATTSPQYGYKSSRGVVGQYADTRITDAELRGVGASFSPAVVPYATQPVPQTPSSWPTSSCSVATVNGPDGTATAGELTIGSGVGSSLVYTYSVTPTVGDWIFYGTWVNTPDSAGFVAATSGNFGTQILIDNNANQAHFQINGTNVAISNYWTTSMLGDWWHPVVAVTQITGADGTAGVIRLQLPCRSNHAMQFWKPFLMYVPASANMSLKEAMRIRQQMLHGYVPSSASTGNLYALDPVIAPGVDIQASPIMEELTNNTASGATMNKLVCATNVGGAMKAQTCPTSSLFWSGVAVGGATGSTAGNTQIARLGQTSCIFDGTTVIGDYVQPSATVAGDCHDTGASTYPTSGAVISRVWTVNSGIGTAATVNLYSPGISASAAGGVTTVTGTSPIASSGGATPAISIATCAAGTLGACAPDNVTITASGGVLTDIGAFVPLVLDFTRTAAASGIGCTGAAPGPYTCTGFPTGTHVCTVYLVSGGGGGASGALEPSGTNAFGGGGGASASAQMMKVPCNAFGAGTTATVTVTVGQGGTGGTAQSTNSTNGVNGIAGTASSISGAASSFWSMATTTSNPGLGGTTTTGTGGVAPTSTVFTGCTGAAGTSTTGTAAQCTVANAGPGAGAGGGGVNTTPTAAAGGAQAGPSSQSLRGAQLINTAGGTVGNPGQTPAFANGTPASTTTFFLSALGGTGGGANAAGNGGTGGTGMFPGGGGGGGGAALNGSSSGAGGAGGDGLVRVLVQ